MGGFWKFLEKGFEEILGRVFFFDFLFLCFSEEQCRDSEQGSSAGFLKLVRGCEES